MELLLMIGIGVGLASVAGVRAFLPLALAAFFTIFGLFEFPVQVINAGEWTFFGGFVVLAALEITLDKIPALERIFNIVMVPIRVVAGAVLFQAAFGLDWEAGPVTWLAIGAAIAGIIAVLKVLLRPPARVEASGVSARFLSVVEDVVALVGGVMSLFIPFLALFAVAFLLFFYFSVRKRRGRKYGGLRILGD